MESGAQKSEVILGVFTYEGGFCGSAIRKPGDLGERGFIVQTNNYNSPSMSPYNLGVDYFRDTYVRYATAFQKLAPAGSVGLDFAKALWAANDWYDASANTWHTVPIPIMVLWTSTRRLRSASFEAKTRALPIGERFNTISSSAG
jgi:hypothetical protein